MAWNVKIALNRAFSMEKESYELYVRAQKLVTSPSSKKILERLAEEELRHKAKIEAALKDERLIEGIGPTERELPKKGIIDFVEETELSKDADYHDLLIYAGKREAQTYEYYLELSKRLKNSEVGSLFERLASEELSHKSRIEEEYEEQFLKEN